MSALPKPMTIEEFLAWEERQELKYEYDGARVQAMTGGAYAHARIQSNLILAIGSRLQGGRCAIVGSELKVRTATSIRYPDALVVCPPPAPEATFTSNAIVIFEVLSRSTAAQDLGPKSAEYQSLPSLQRYVVLQQRVSAAEVFLRQDDDAWGHEFVQGDEILHMPEIGGDVPLEEIYRGVASR